VDVLEHGPSAPPFDIRRAIIVAVFAALLVAGAGVWAFRLAGDVPRGTRVLGADLGGLSRTEAEQELHDHVDGHAADPVRIRLDGKAVQIDPAVIGIRMDVDATVGRAIRAGARDVVPVVRIDRARFEAELRRHIPADRIMLRRPGLTFRGLTALPAYPQTGLDLDVRKAAQAVKVAWPTGAIAEVPLVPRTADDPASLGIRERVSTFTTRIGGDQSVRGAAAAVDGTILRPGETFSLNAHDRARGSSTFATTLFNAAYYAGLQDVEHTPHSSYFPQFPAVIEARVSYPALDLRFRNTTPYGIWIATAVTSRSVTVAMWSTRVYDSVRTEYEPRRAVCGTRSGLPGFTQDAWRVIRKDGQEIAREMFTWRYDPEPRLVCGAMP
jgi:hypothetical protein